MAGIHFLLVEWIIAFVGMTVKYGRYDDQVFVLFSETTLVIRIYYPFDLQILSTKSVRICGSLRLS